MEQSPDSSGDLTGISVDTPVAIEKLGATGPNRELAEKLMLYGRFVGSWDIESVDIDENGHQLNERTGEWHFAWILGGRGVQDVIYAAGAPPEHFGTTLRCYDEDADVWRVSFMQPAGGEFVQLIGREIDGRIVQVRIGPDLTRQERWTLSDITPKRFRWHGEVSLDDGHTWRLIQAIRARRASN